MTYNPQNWYWIVNGSTTQVYSSASSGYVAITDTTYVAWLAAGGVPTKIDSEADLWGVLTAANVSPYNSVSTATITARLTTAGLASAVATYIAANPVIYLKFLTNQTLMVTDSDLATMLTAIGANPTTILAP
jgi:hypothetical protein